MISVIIPVYNEERTIGKTVAFVFAHALNYKRLLKQVIVVDGGSSDNSAAEAERAGAKVIHCAHKDRAALMNHGAQHATGSVLYFFNGHSFPPGDYIADIVKATNNGHACGTFAMEFDKAHWLLNFISWCTKPNRSWFYLSDQSLFITRELFTKAGGFREDHLVMINQEMIQRLRRYTDFITIKDSIIISSARFSRDGIVRTGMIQGLAFMLHRLGYPQNVVTHLYRKSLGWKIGPEPVKAPVQHDIRTTEDHTVSVAH